MDISILMITFNHEKFISEAIDSVLAQVTNYSWELIIGDDCSSDGTREIIESYILKYPQKIKLLPRLRNIGMMNNFVESLNNCSGQFIAFLEGDDYWCDPKKLQKQVEFLESNQTIAICATAAMVKIESKNEFISDTTTNVYEKKHFSTKDLLLENPAHTCTYVIRKKAVPILKDGYLKLRLGDFPLWILCSKSGDLVKLPYVSAVYRVHSSGVWSSESQIKKEQYFEEMYAYLLGEFPHKSMKQIINAQRHSAISRVALYSINNNGIIHSIPAIWRAVTFVSDNKFSIFNRILPFLGILPKPVFDTLLGQLRKFRDQRRK